MSAKPKVSPSNSPWFESWNSTTTREFELVRMLTTPERVSDQDFDCYLFLQSKACASFLSKFYPVARLECVEAPRMRLKLNEKKLAHYPFSAMSVPVTFDSLTPEESSQFQTCYTEFVYGDRLVPLGFDHVSEARVSGFINHLEFRLSNAERIYDDLSNPLGLLRNMSIIDWLYKLVFFCACSSVGLIEFKKSILSLNESDLDNSWSYVSMPIAETLYGLALDIYVDETAP